MSRADDSVDGWNATTRPVDRNGLGLTTNEADLEVCAIEAGMELLPDSAAQLRTLAEASWLLFIG